MIGYFDMVDLIFQTNVKFTHSKYKVRSVAKIESFKIDITFEYSLDDKLLNIL